MGYAIACFLSLTAEAAILWQYACALFAPRQGKAGKSAAALCALFILLLAVSFTGLAWMNTAAYLIACFLFLLSQYRLKWYAAFFHSAVLTSVMALCELFVYSIIVHIMPQFFGNGPDFYNTVLLAIFSKLLLFIILYVLMHTCKALLSDARQYDHSVLLLVCIPISSVLIVLTFMNISYHYPLSSGMLELITFNAVYLLLTTLLAFGINQHNQKKNAEFTDMQLLLQKEANAAEYYKMLVAQNENQNIFIHDIKQHLQSIAALNSERDHERIDSYIDFLLHSPELKEYALCDHGLLNTILCRCKRQCDEKQIAFHTDIRSKTIDFMADNDLTSLFGNLLDNALESASHMSPSFIEVDAKRNGHAPFIVITVTNSCRTDPFRGPDKELPTKKADRRRHGFGIKSIKKTVKKYNGKMQMYYSVDTRTFHTIITLKTTQHALAN